MTIQSTSVQIKCTVVGMVEEGVNVFR
jgi:hypothetical protein